MTDPTQSLKDDIAFLRELTQETSAPFAREAAVMIAVGLIFGVVDLLYWLVFAHLLSVPVSVSFWFWVIGLLLFITCVSLANRNRPAPRGVAARTIAAAWGGIGVSLTAAGIGLILGGWRLSQPDLVLWVFPIMLFTLYGAAWSVAFAAKRRAGFGFVAAGCFAVAVAEGALMSSPGQWLVMSIGLFVLVAVPGVVILRQSRDR